MKKPYKPRAMLVTGGAGFIGSHFVKYVLSHHPNIFIINLDKLTYAGSLEKLSELPNPENHHFIQGDINDKKLIQHILLHHHIDTIVHFAAESHVDRSITSPSAFLETNVTGTYNLLEAARHHWFDVEESEPTHCRFHHISTDEVYGTLKLGDLAFSEKSPYHPRSPYSATKASSDHLVYAYYHTYGLPITLSHCSNNYGPHQDAEKFIPTIINACLAGKKIPIYGEGKQIRDWLYVEDHCRGIMDIINFGVSGETYDMGGHTEMQNIELAHYICQQIDALKPHEYSHASLIEFVTDRLGHDFRYAIDTCKIKSELGWTPNVAIESGIKKTIHFYMHNHEKNKIEMK